MNKILRMALISGLAMVMPLLGQAQATQLPRTLKAYPLRLFAGELLLSYEHGIGPHISATGGLGLHGSGIFAQLSAQSGASANDGCRTVFPGSGFTVMLGPRWYPGKLTRKGPFFLELLLVYRRTDYQAFTEYGSSPCNSGNPLAKEIRPLVTRAGFQLMCGGALRRDKRFTMDMFGGLGLRNITTDERQEVVPDVSPIQPFHFIEQPTSVVAPSLHLGLSLGFNFAAAKRR